MSGALTERDMLDRLAKRYAMRNANGVRYARAEHVKSSAGFDARRVCDFMAMDLWTGYGENRGPKLHGHEVKVARSDWLTELRDPEKAESFARYCDFWWLVVADKTIVRDDLPEGWGLMVAYRDTTRVLVQPARRNPEPMPRALQATLMRATAKTARRRALADAGATYDPRTLDITALAVETKEDHRA